MREFRPVYQYEDGEYVTLDAVKWAISEAAQNLDVPVAFYPDQVKSGNLFNKSVEDCLVMYNPEHKNDYYLICIRVQHQGNLAYVAINNFGSSLRWINLLVRSMQSRIDRERVSLIKLLQ